MLNSFQPYTVRDDVKANKKTDFIHLEGLAKASPMFLDYQSLVVQTLANACT